MGDVSPCLIGHHNTVKWDGLYPEPQEKLNHLQCSIMRPSNNSMVLVINLNPSGDAWAYLQQALVVKIVDAKGKSKDSLMHRRSYTMRRFRCAKKKVCTLML